MKINVENAAGLVDRFIADELPGIEYPDGRSSGRGIVIAAGGRKYQINAWVALNLLRRSGCTLPVECWYLGKSEFDSDWAAMVEPLGASCVDAHQVRESHDDSWIHHHERLHGWELKPYAITHSRFQEVLFLDADNVPVVDPTFLFETPQFLENGAIFWPDYGRLEPDRQAWRVFGDISYRDEPEVESGQIVIDKKRCWQCLALCHWYMQNSNNFYFFHVHGDKEFFHLAWRKLGRPYGMPTRGIHGLPGVMCQHDFEGRRIFQHRNMRKWSLGHNPSTTDFRYEAECIEHLDDLRRRWNPLSVHPDSISADDRSAMESAAGRYLYERVGFDRRALTLDRDGLVDQGRGGREIYWRIERGRLHLVGEDAAITAALLSRGDGVWVGHWNLDERMAILLKPLTEGDEDPSTRHPSWTPVRSEALTLTDADRTAMEALAGTYRYQRVGHDERDIILNSDGSIGRGAAAMEKHWYVQQDQLHLASAEFHLTVTLSPHDDGAWRGRWVVHERMPIVLRRLETPTMPEIETDAAVGPG